MADEDKGQATGAPSSGARRQALLTLGMAGVGIGALYLLGLPPFSRGPIGPRVDLDGPDAPWRAHAATGAIGPEDAPRVALALLLPSTAAAALDVSELPGGAPLTLIQTAADGPPDLAAAPHHELLLGLHGAGPAGDPTRDAWARSERRLQPGLSPRENLRRLEDRLASGGPYLGVAVLGDGPLAGDLTLLRQVYRAAAERGLLALDGRGLNAGVAGLIGATHRGPAATAQVLLDADPSTDAMARALAAVEATARRERGCVALARAEPATLAAIGQWARRGAGASLRLEAVSALVRARRLASV
ncbi:MAG: divergent polysaccharide deacetylase family protein [Pseudomonadota bacterium]